jgi:hypothetical protein
MPRLESFKLKIKTGERGFAGTPAYTINGFPQDFDSVEGGTGPGETAVLVGSPQSFPHLLLLSGPQEGAWDIDGIQAEYQCAGEDPYTVRLGGVSLDDQSDLNIWHPRPQKLLDV